MRIRKSAAKLPPREQERYVTALKALKSDIVETLDDGTAISRYDQIVALHLGVTRRFIGDIQLIDGGHRRPAFLPWHRQYLATLEQALRAVDPQVSIPYWDWLDLEGTENVIFQDSFLGPAGSGPGFVGPVPSGHFTRENGWPLVNEIHRNSVTTDPRGTSLLRNTRLDFASNLLPTETQIEQVMQLESLEATFPQRGFSQELEVTLHNPPHGWVGGTMGGMSSPNDPIFFLHHANVDRLWAEWQADGHAGPSFYPETVAPDGSGRPTTGHALRDAMWPWDDGQARTLDTLVPYLPDTSGVIRPLDVIDTQAMSYVYDTLLPVLNIGQTIVDIQLADADDEQGFRIVLQQAGRYRIEKQGSSNTLMQLYGPDGWEFMIQDQGTGFVSREVDLQSGTYFVVLQPATATDTGVVSLSLQQQDVVEPTVLLALNAAPLQANIGRNGEVDVYRFVVETLGEYTIETEGQTDVLMSLYGPNNRNSLVIQDDDSGEARNARISSRLTAGTYHLEVRHYFPTGRGTYAISVQTDSIVTPDDLVVDGPEVQGEIGIPNESDLYRFSISQTGTYTIETSGRTDTFLSLFGPNSETTLIAQDDDSGPGLLSQIRQALEPGQYVVRVRHYSALSTGPYGIRLSS